MAHLALGGTAIPRLSLAAAGCHSVGIYARISRSLLSFSVEMTSLLSFSVDECRNDGAIFGGQARAAGADQRAQRHQEPPPGGEVIATPPCLCRVLDHE